MRILQLCTRVPFPPNDGGSIAMYNLAKSLADGGCEVKVLAFNTRKHFIPGNKINPVFSKSFKLETVFLDASVKPLDAFLNLFDKESYNIKRFISDDFTKKLAEILSAEKFDIVQMESLFMSPYINTVRKHSNAKVVLRAHNVEHIIWQRLHNSEKKILKKSYLKLLSERLSIYEKSIINSFDALLPMTDDDEKIYRQIGSRIPHIVTPAGIDVTDYKKSINGTLEQPFSLYHLASMDWMPNLEAVDWFLKNVWESLLKKIPQAQLHIAGKAMPMRIFERKTSNLFVYGKIDDAKAFIAGKQVMIVPLLSGSGMRIKILEGLAAGKAIVSTATGAEGIKYSDKKNILIADTPLQFIEAVERLYNDRKFLSELSRNARNLAENEYDNKIIAKKLIAFYNGLLE